MNKLKTELNWQLCYDMELLKQLKEELSSLPEGYLVFKKIKGKEYLYIRRKTVDSLGNLRKKELLVNSGRVQEARGILRRRFVEKSIRQLTEEIKNVQLFSKLYNPYNPDVVYQSLLKGAASLLDASDSSTRSTILNTAALDVEPVLESFREGKKHYTTRGLMVRSKSEALIAGILELYNLDFRYEQKLSLGSDAYYPDFTIRIPNSRDWIYWEHFGLMSEPEYRNSMENKIETYANYGIIPWNNLIMTFDSEDGSINMQRIHQILCNMLGLTPLTK